MPLTRLGEDLIDEILAEYPELKSLNLSENEIKIFEQLDRIVSLERVNLSHNRLIQIGGGVLPHLIDLNLSYNQLATTRGFHDIFPQLKNLDVSHNRIEQFSDLSDLRFNLHLKTLQLHGNVVALQKDYRAEIVSQLESLSSLDNIVITSQERVPKSLQRDISSQVTVRGPSSEIFLLDSSISLPKQENSVQELCLVRYTDKSELMQERIAALEEILALQEAELGDEKVQNLLNLWRNKVFELMVKQSIACVELKDCETQFKQVERKLTTECRVLQSKVSDFQAKCNLLQTTSQKQKFKTEHLTKKCAVLNSETQSKAQSLRYLTRFIIRFVQEFPTEFPGLERLTAFEKRLELATERVKMIQTIVSRRNVQVRNTVAAYEAKHRVVAQHKKETAVPKETLRVRGLRPEAQYLVRQLFNQMDYYHTGLVNQKAFIQAIGRDPKLQEAMESKDKWLETLKWIQTRPIEHENITFGEILLWFIPGDEETPAFDVDMTVPPEFTPLNNAVSQSDQMEDYTRLNHKELQAELHRMRSERDYLLQRVQEDAFQLKERATLIQSQWQSKVNGLIAQVAKYNERKHQDEVAFQSKTRENQEVEEVLKTVRQEKHDLQAELDQMKQNLKIQLEESDDRQKKQLDTVQNEMRAKIDALERSNADLKKELAKSGLENRHLARQLSKAQEEHESKLEYVQTKLEKAQTEVNKVRRERNSILGSLREHERVQSEKDCKLDELAALSDALLSDDLF